ncbi:MAG: DUF3618 domain-containing protein [Sphingomonadales bacterium]|nr:MAG: DUF3618 domain-containing protein [Sphingomonadales bacterium]
MKPNRHDVNAAQAQVDTARARLFGTLAQVQDRLKPSNIAQEAVESAAHGVATVARRGAEAVRSRPLAAAGFAGLVGLVMARGWIGDIMRERNETPEPEKGLKEKAARPAKKGSPK